MAEIDDRFNVKFTLQIDKLDADPDGPVKPFDTTVKTMYDCNRVVMHAIESALAAAFVELGDIGIVLLGGEAGEAILVAQKEARGKARGQSK